jgi:hypothetical protein
MAPRTREAIEELGSVEWFCDVGRPLEDSSFSRAKDWKEAVALALGDKWRDVRMDAQGAYDRGDLRGFGSSF